MEQLVMQTQQSTDLKAKLPAKKTKAAKEKQTDFGKALEQQAANYAQAAASDVNAKTQTLLRNRHCLSPRFLKV